MSGSDRVGALDFQASPTHYVPRMAGETTLAQLMRAADAVEQGLTLSPELEDALRRPVSHISSTLRLASRSSLRLEGVDFHSELSRLSSG